MTKFLQNPVLYGVLAVCFAFLPVLNIASQIAGCSLCAILYTFINKKIMPVAKIFVFACAFAVILTFVCGCILFYEFYTKNVPSFWQPFLQIFPVSVFSFLIGFFIFYPVSLITYGILVLFQGKLK